MAENHLDSYWESYDDRIHELICCIWTARTGKEFPDVCNGIKMVSMEKREGDFHISIPFFPLCLSVFGSKAVPNQCLYA